jgi:hypothetical protein
MEYARGGAAGDKVDFALIVDEETGVAGGKRALGGESRRHVVARKLTPVVAVAGVDEKELAVHRIAQGEALFFGDADERVEEESRTLVGKLEFPTFAAVGGFVDARIFGFAAGHGIGDLFIEGLDSAEIERDAGIDEEPSKMGAAIL